MKEQINKIILDWIGDNWKTIGAPEPERIQGRNQELESLRLNVPKLVERIISSTEKTYVNIWSNEHSGWWRPEKCGYTNYRSLAGKYTIDEAIKICSDANKYIDFEKHYPDNTGSFPNEVIVPVTIE